jgi:lysophospholipase L1-like esterase
MNSEIIANGFASRTMSGMRTNILLTLVMLFILRAASAEDKLPAWVEPMRKVHAEFDGDRNYVAQFGDSITTSLAFWSPLGWDDPEQYLPDDDGLPKKPDGKRWRDVIQGVRDKGSTHGNDGGWRVENILRVQPQVLKEKRPATAIIMVGTNDVRGNKVPAGYGKGLTKIVDDCLAAKCIPLLTTIPPMRDHDEAVAEANKLIRELAAERKIPLIDYHQAILERRPDHSWDKTLISGDGVHPSAGKTNVYSADNLKDDGYALRNWVTFLKFREVYFHVLAKK